MSFLGLDITLFDTLIIVNVLAVFFTFITATQVLRGMKQENKQQYAHQLRDNQRRKHISQQQHDDEPLVIKLPAKTKKEKFLPGNDIRVLSKKKIPLTTVQKISKNIGEN